jgi:hypothetical protein
MDGVAATPPLGNGRGRDLPQRTGHSAFDQRHHAVFRDRHGSIRGLGHRRRRPRVPRILLLAGHPDRLSVEGTRYIAHPR